ncbi:MAG: SDR family NAD(P)-dependent oxidoreductase [Cyclobacteriaceae bacterium]
MNGYRHNKYNFEGKVVIVTGSAEGIGYSIAKGFYQHGAMVVIADIQKERGLKAASSLGDRACFVECDIVDVNSVDNLVNETIARFGKLDIMINNAGINTTASHERVPFYEYPESTWEKLIKVDLTGTFNCCKRSCVELLKQGNGGVIINVASVAGVVALRLQIGFVAAKAAIIRMTEAMAIELAGSQIRVNCISPGSTLTQATEKLFYSEDGSFSKDAERLLSFIPAGRPGLSEEIASAVMYLSSDEASYINGHNLVVDGGWTSGFNRDF